MGGGRRASHEPSPSIRRGYRPSKTSGLSRRSQRPLGMHGIFWNVWGRELAQLGLAGPCLRNLSSARLYHEPHEGHEPRTSEKPAEIRPPLSLQLPTALPLMVGHLYDDPSDQAHRHGDSWSCHVPSPLCLGITHGLHDDLLSTGRSRGPGHRHGERRRAYHPPKAVRQLKPHAVCRPNKGGKRVSMFDPGR